MYQLIFHSEADKDFSEATHWYETQKVNLGKRFILSVEAVITKIQHNPTVFGYIKRPFREASVPMFPYTIVYKINKKKNTVWIIAIYHTSRNPKRKYRKT